MDPCSKQEDQILYQKKYCLLELKGTETEGNEKRFSDLKNSASREWIQRAT